MEELNAYSFKEFIELNEEERELYKSFGLKTKPDNWGKVDILEWGWALIKNLQDLLNKPYLTYNDMSEIISLASGISYEEIYKLKWFDVFKFYNFVTKGIEQINEIEKQINYEPTNEEISAGIEEYNQFGWFVTLNRLAGGDILKHEDIGNQKYCDVFAVLKLQKIDAQFNKNLMKKRNV
jgi:hypothetical protein